MSFFYESQALLTYQYVTAFLCTFHLCSHSLKEEVVVVEEEEEEEEEVMVMAVVAITNRIKEERLNYTGVSHSQLSMRSIHGTNSCTEQTQWSCLFSVWLSGNVGDSGWLRANRRTALWFRIFKHLLLSTKKREGFRISILWLGFETQLCCALIQQLTAGFPIGVSGSLVARLATQRGWGQSGRR